MIWKTRGEVLSAVVLLTAGAIICLLCGACERHDISEADAHGHQHDSEHIHRHAEPGQCENIGVSVKLSPEIVEKIGLKMAKPAVRKRVLTATLTGRVCLNEDMLAHISPRAQGAVSDVYVTLGDEVDEGDVLALVGSTELREAKAEYLTAKATLELLGQDYDREKKLYRRKVLVELNSVRAEYLSAKATAELLEKNYEREKALFEKKIAAEKDLVEAETEYKKALIDLENSATKLRLIGLDRNESEKEDWTPDPDKIGADGLSKVITEAQKELYQAEKEYEKAKIALQFAEAKLHLLGLDEKEVESIKSHGDLLTELPVRAPFAGTIVEKHASVGENVGPDSHLFSLADLGTLWVQADVYEKDIAYIRSGLSAAITCAAYPGEVFEGVVTYAHHLFDESGNKGRVRIEVSSDGKLKAGMFVKAAVDLSAAEKSKSLFVPKQAVQNDGTCCNFVFVCTEQNSFESRQVSLGVEQGGEVEISSGLKADDSVVVEGSFSLKSEILKANLGSG